MIALELLYAVVFTIAWAVFGHDITLSFNTSEPPDGRTYIARTGETVTLTCKLPGDVLRDVDITMTKGTSTTELVSDGELAATASQRYDPQKQDGGAVFNLVIRNLVISDSSRYICKSKHQCLRCLFWWVWTMREAFVDLRVMERGRKMDFCTLSNGLNGLFFSDERLMLSCPEGTQLEIKVANRTQRIVATTKENKKIAFTLNNNAGLFNNSVLACPGHKKNEKHSVDYCRDLPGIKVYESLQVIITPPNRPILLPEGGNLTLTCVGRPTTETTSFEWDSEDYYTSSGNALISETRYASSLEMTDVKFTNATRETILIKCTVRVESRNATTWATIVRQYQVTSQATTMLPTDDFVTDITDTPGGDVRVNRIQYSTDTQKRDQGGIYYPTKKPKSDTKVDRIQGIWVAIGISVPFFAVVAVSGYLWERRKHRRKCTDRELSTGQSSDAVGGNNRIEAREMGLSPQEAEVTRNVIYEPYYQGNENTDMGLSPNGAEITMNIIYEPYRGEEGGDG